jgi:hypothetical protein
MAFAALTEHAEAAGFEALALSPRMGDLNEDLNAFNLRALRAALRIQLASRMSFGLYSSLGPGWFDRSASGAPGNWADYVVLSVMLRTAVDIGR